MKGIDQNTQIILWTGILGLASLAVLAFVPEAREQAGMGLGASLASLATMARQAKHEGMPDA